MFDHRKKEFLIDVDSACPFRNGKSLDIHWQWTLSTCSRACSHFSLVLISACPFGDVKSLINNLLRIRPFFKIFHCIYALSELNPQLELRVKLFFLMVLTEGTVNFEPALKYVIVGF